MLGLTVAGGLATVNLNRSFVSSPVPPSLLARLSQVVHTLTGPEGATRVRVLIKGGTPLGLFPGAYAAGPITVKYLQAPKTPTPKPPEPSSAAKPINTVCPVSGKPVVLPNTLAYEGKTVGFCCSGCASSWAKLSNAEKDTKLAAAMK